MKKLRIATRGSKLAVWQAMYVKGEIERARPGTEVELVRIKTRGDKITDRPLAAIGGKALFVKEIQQALFDGDADVAVHSMKDVPAGRAPGLVMAAISSREDPRDALCTTDGGGLDSLPEGAHVGTASMRRQCQLKAARPDLRVSTLRGNVPTRLGKLDDGSFDAIVLAVAGLVRLGFGDRISERLPVDVSLPAVGQGVLGLEVRAGEDELAEIVKQAVHDPVSERRVACERAFLERLGGSCQTPLAGYALAETTDGELDFRGLVGRPDGTEVLSDRVSGSAADAEALGIGIADALLERGARAIIEACEEMM